MKRLFVFLTILLIFSCSKVADSDPVYQTSYTVRLDAVPAEVPMDSAVVEVFVDGGLDTVLTFPASTLQGQSISFTVESDPGQMVRIEYKVYSGGDAVVDGVDEFDPEDPSDKPGALAVDSTVLHEVVELLRSSSSEKRSSSAESSSQALSSATTSSRAASSGTVSSATASSGAASSGAVSSVGASSAPTSSAVASSSTPQSSVAGVSSNGSSVSPSSSTVAYNEAFTVQFERVSSTIYEDSVSGSAKAPYVKIVLTGDANSKLLTARTVSILRSGGNAEAGDFSLLGTVSIPKDALSGFTKNLSLGILSDDLVEGEETIVLSIEDAQDLAIGANGTHTVSIHDADSAWVEFTADTVSVAESSGSAQVGIRLRTSPATATLETAVGVKAVFDEEEANYGTDFTYTSSGSSAVFAAGSGDQTPKSFTITVVNDDVRELVDWCWISLQISSGPATAGNVASGGSPYLPFVMRNDDFEYLVMVDTVLHNLMFYSPEGAYVNRYYDSRIDIGTQGVAARTNGNVLITDDAGVLEFNMASKTFSVWSTVSSLTDITEVAGSDSLWGINQTSLVWITKSTGALAGSRAFTYPGNNARNYVSPAASYAGVFTASFYDADMDLWGTLGFQSKTTISENRYGDGDPGQMLYAPVGFTSDGAATAYLLTASGYNGSFQLVKYPMATSTPTFYDHSDLSLAIPKGIALSPQGTLYIVDGKAYGSPTSRYRLMEYDPNTEQMIRSSSMETKVDHFEIGSDLVYLQTHSEVPVAP